MLGGLFDLKPIVAYAAKNPPQWDTVTTSICCFCAVGCGLLVGTSTTDPDAVYVQGNPDHPINQGSLCSKGQAMGQVHTVDGAPNPRRLTVPLYRAAGATTWTTMNWNTALGMIAAKIKATRDATTVETELIDGTPTPVNRCDGIACLGGAAHDNEECYLLVKLMRALGLVYIEHQARI
jgi:formate dehydrogenase major subunit